mgnify:CR=1 FL=1
MDNLYFKDLEKYNIGEKLSDQNMILRLEKHIKDNIEHITLNNVVDYIIYENEFIVKIDTQIVFYGNTIPHHETIIRIRL